MGLGSHAIAFGLGAVLGHPSGRERARRVAGQAAGLTRRPEAVRLREKGSALVGQVAQTATRRLRRSSAEEDAGPTTTATAANPTGAAADHDTSSGGRRLGRLRLARPRRRPGGIDVATSAAPGPVGPDPVGGNRAERVTDGVSVETEAAMLGSLPPADPGRGRTS